MAGDAEKNKQKKEIEEVAVRLSEKKFERGDRKYRAYTVAFPKKFVEKLGLKRGAILHARIVEVDITENGETKRVRGVLYYRP